MSELPTRDQIKPGSKVSIELKQNQRNGKLTEGIVKKILTASLKHPHGIKVELENSQVGRVKKIIIKMGKTNKEFSSIDIFMEIGKYSYKVDIQEILSNYNLPYSGNKDELLKTIYCNKTILEKSVKSLLDELLKDDLVEICQTFDIDYSGKVKELKENILKNITEPHKPISKNESKNNSKSNTNNIPKDEDTWNEFKSTFQYDLAEENLRKNGKTEAADARKNNHKKIKEDIQKEVSLTIAAFANQEGGKLFIGVNDDSTILGLGRDLKEYGNSIDKLTLTITDSLKKFLQNNAFIAKLKFDFVTNEDKQYLIIQVPKSTEPIFVNVSNGQEAYVRIQKSSEKFSYEDFIKHCKDRF